MKIGDGDFIDMWEKYSIDEIAAATSLSRRGIETRARKLRRSGENLRSHRLGRQKFGGATPEVSDQDFIIIWNMSRSLGEVAERTGLKRPSGRRNRMIRLGRATAAQLPDKRANRQP